MTGKTVLGDVMQMAEVGDVMLTHRLSPIASRLRQAEFGRENNRGYSHDLIAFRIETTLKFDAKSSF